ncbi:N-acetyldiaminopimelate deacetylase [Halobacillus karajensis]|uniref:N-acetyldiaminopimelate deacetylase n=1 Tax=Halobacillus karajensis TaxID=195088 RepID=A0A024P278_9BACI|nr:N-acetyldiaminopimelate deacetylase [Halobacillus karajensis]CDQ19924.1 N-acetyldiaminopimelate deacetylase [Halobacillus karajensis]CDQ22384.1 N-acetyldiaminopimelate deacetylase [Halobacillus karajensis]CDQ28227.1 N-acetyldiaminopimelate deacetylase [Halobacillus karajensis]SEH69796.1 N-acetyldiaminopimelate deacetylase [Halobacillus karajensis]
MEQEQLIKVRRALHQIPELGFKEYETQKYLLDFIETLPQSSLTVETWKTGIFVHVKGSVGGKTIGYRADIDGLPLTEETGYQFRSVHEGLMHACGHDFHMTIALGALARLAESPVEDHIVFIFQPAEEGPGGAEPMLQSAQMEQFRPDVIFGLHVAPELPVGTVSSKPGLLFANTSELFIDFKGVGGHAAFPHLTHDMVVTASAFVSHLQQIVARRVDPLDSAVITVGKIEAGTVQNIIAQAARLEGTIRTLSPEAMEKVKGEIEKVARGFEIANDCGITIDYGSNYHQVYNDAKQVERFEKIVEDSPYSYQEAKMAMTGEDFGYMLKEIPGFMFWLGVDSEAGLHQASLKPEEDALVVGVDLVEKGLREL